MEGATYPGFPERGVRCVKEGVALLILSHFKKKSPMKMK